MKNLDLLFKWLILCIYNLILIGLTVYLVKNDSILWVILLVFLMFVNKNHIIVSRPEMGDIFKDEKTDRLFWWTGETWKAIDFNNVMKSINEAKSIITSSQKQQENP